jgi:cysteine desulfurase
MSAGGTDRDRRNVVRQEHSKVGQQGGSCCGPSGCCGGPPVASVAAAVGYDQAEVRDSLAGAHRGLTRMDPIYLDHNATTQPDPVVVAEMLPCLQTVYGNPSSMHGFGQEARRVLDVARQRVASLIGATPEEIIFTSGGTEANNHALWGAAEALGRPGSHIVTTAVEHEAVLNPCRRLEKAGYRVTYVTPDRDGKIVPADVAAAMTAGTVLVSVMLANNEVGTVEPLREIAEIAHACGAWVHTDAVQAVGKIPVDVNDLRVDLLSFSAHKLHGPKGIGALYVRQGLDIGAFILGGSHERQRRAGTENIPAIAGFGKACELAGQRLAETQVRLRGLSARLERGILERLPQARSHGRPELRLPNTVSIGFPGVNADHLAVNLDIQGIAVSTTAACSSSRKTPSHVLLAMGSTPEEATSTIRFSLGMANTEQQIDRVVDVVVQTVRQLRGSG